MDNPFVLPEFSGDIASLNRRKALADMLLKQSLTPQAPQMAGRIMPKTSKFAPIAQALTAYLANKTATDAEQGLGDIRTKSLEAEQAALQKLQGLPEDDAIAEGQRSNFPRAQAMAKALADSRAKRLELQVGAIKDTDAQGAARIAGAGRPSLDYASPAMKPMETGELAGSQYAITYDRKQQPTLKFAPKGIQVNNQIPGNEAQMGLGVLETGLKPREEAATAAKNVYATTAKAVDALARGAKAGGGQGVKQTLRDVLQAFGTTLPANAETRELSMALGNVLLAEAGKIKPISNTDISTLEKIVGSIDTDPNALVKALAFAQGVSLDAMRNFDRYVAEQEKTVTNDVARSRLAGVRVGREAPKNLTGPTSFQLAVLREMQNAGLDITGFGDPLTGKPMDQNTRFNIDAGAAFPAARENRPASQKGAPESDEAYRAKLQAWLSADPATRGPAPLRGR